MDVNDQARLMQIDGDLNPGNSGGPIVDDAGQVVGVAVATVRRTNIGFAIPLAPVVEMLAGTLTDLQGELSSGGVRVRAQLLDPLGCFESARLHVRAMREDAVLDLLGDKGRWQSIAPKAKAVAFTREDEETLEAEHALPDRVGADRTVRERLREIIASQWDEPRIKRTFVRSFESTPNADAQRRATELAQFLVDKA